MNSSWAPVRLSAAVMLLGAASAASQESGGDVKTWLDRMNTAAEQLNYSGTLVHVVDGNPETLHIVHRFADGVVSERISSAGDVGREILTTEDAVRSTFPEHRLVMVEEPHQHSNPLTSSLSYTDGLEHYYQITTFAKGSIAGRDTQIVSIRARDEFRYGYLLWLDHESALPLKTQVRDESGRVIESLLFTEISFLDAIPDLAVAPVTNIEGFTWKRPGKNNFETTANEIWGATRLPNGFRLSVSRQGHLAGSDYPMQHLVYTDGLATVSVFIAHPDAAADIPTGFSRFGSANAYSLKIDGHLATAIGEVPSLTVQRIATSLDAR